MNATAKPRRKPRCTTAVSTVDGGGQHTWPRALPRVLPRVHPRTERGTWCWEWHFESRSTAPPEATDTSDTSSEQGETWWIKQVEMAQCHSTQTLHGTDIFTFIDPFQPTVTECCYSPQTLLVGLTYLPTLIPGQHRQVCHT